MENEYLNLKNCAFQSGKSIFKPLKCIFTVKSCFLPPAFEFLHRVLMSSPHSPESKQFSEFVIYIINELIIIKIIIKMTIIQ